MAPSPGHSDSLTPPRATPKSTSDGSVRLRRPSSPATPTISSHSAAHALPSVHFSTPATASPPPGSMEAALSFVKRINITVARKPLPASAASQVVASSDGDGDSAAPAAAPAAPEPPPNQPIVMETEVIEPAAPGSAIGAPLNDDTLDRMVAVPSLERSTVADYAAAADNWLMTDRMLVQYEEFMARGLLMVRNIVRQEPRYAAQASTKWMPVVRDSLANRHGLIRAAAASALAAFAVNTPGRDAIQKDPLVLPRVVQMLTTGIDTGCDNTDTQYACLALSNIAMNHSCKQPLLRNGVLPRAADVLRAAIRWFENMGFSGPRGSGSGASNHAGGGGGSLGQPNHGIGRGFVSNNFVCFRKVPPILKSATYMTTLLTCWSVDATGRHQLQQYGIPELTAELHERCSAAQGEDAPLSRRLALLVEAISAIELLEVIEETAAELGATWDYVEDPDARVAAQAVMLRGVSFAETVGRNTMTRAAAAMDALHKMLAAEETGPAAGPGVGAGPGHGSGTGCKPGSPLSVAMMTPAVSMALRTLSRKQSAPGDPGAFSPTGFGATGSTATSAGATPATSAAAAPPPPCTPPTPALLTAIAAANTSTASSIVAAPPGGGGCIVLSPRDTAGSRQGGRGLAASRVPQTSTSHSQSFVSASSPQIGFSTSVLSPSTSSTPLRTGFLASSASVGSAGHLGPQHQLQLHQLQQQQQTPHLSSPSPTPTVAGGSMMGVHFSASVFQEAAAATGSSRTFLADDDANSLGRRSQSCYLSPSSSQEKSVRLPAVTSKPSQGSGDIAPLPAASSAGGSRGTTGSSPMASRHDHQAHGGRLDLPFHLVRPIPTISASSGKVSRISAAYGQVAGSRATSQGDSLPSYNSYPRTYTAEF